MVDFIFIIIDFFRHLLQLRHYKQNSVEVGDFLKGVSHFQRKFQMEKDDDLQPLLVSEN